MRSSSDISLYCCGQSGQITVIRETTWLETYRQHILLLFDSAGSLKIFKLLVYVSSLYGNVANAQMLLCFRSTPHQVLAQDCAPITTQTYLYQEPSPSAALLPLKVFIFVNIQNFDLGLSHLVATTRDLNNQFLMRSPQRLD